MRNRVVILQDAIMPYRKPFYNALADRFDVCVVHSGPPTVGLEDEYREEIVTLRTVGSLKLQDVGPALARNAPMAAVIAIFDIRWPATLWGASRADARRRLLWGHRYSHRRLVNAFRDGIMRRFDGVIQYGSEDTAAMVARGIPADQIFEAPNTIDVPNHEDLSAAPKSSLLYVGRLQERKRLDDLLDAFASARERLPADVSLDLVGDGDIRDDLERQAVRLGIQGRVRFHGTINDPERLKMFFAAAYAYVSPDNVGLGVLHAFSYGVPVITAPLRVSKVSGYRHGPEFQNLVPGENSLLVEDDVALRDVLIRVTTDTALAARLGAAAYRRYTADRSIERMVDGFAAAIRGDAAERGN